MVAQGCAEAATSPCRQIRKATAAVKLQLALVVGRLSRPAWQASPAAERRRAIAMIDRAILTTAALGRGVFGLQLANLASELVNALPDRCEGERRCFQPLRRP